MMRGHLKTLVLNAVKNKYNTGYCITEYIYKETGKKPSYGSIYPLIKQLKTNKLLTSEKKGKKKLLKLTKEGEKELQKIDEQKELLIKKMEEVIGLFKLLTGSESIHDTKTIKTLVEKGLTPKKSSELHITKKLVTEIMINNPTNKQLKMMKEETKKYNNKLKQIKRIKR